MTAEEKADVFNPPPRPVILNRIQFRKESYDPGQEKEFAASGIPREDVERLTQLGVIAGFENVDFTGQQSEGESEESEEEEIELPPVDKLEKWLAGMDDADKIREIQAQDERKSAQKFYDARLAELEG